MKVALGFMAAKYLFAASEIGLFEALASGPANLEELANRIQVPLRTTGMVAAAMVSLGLIEQEEGSRYRNSPAAATFIAGKPGFDLRPAASLARPYWLSFVDNVSRRCTRRQERSAIRQIRPDAAAVIFSRCRSVHCARRGRARDKVRFQPPSTAA